MIKRVKILFIEHKTELFNDFYDNLEFTTVTDGDRCFWLSRFWSRVFNLLNEIHAACDFTEHYVTAIEPGADHGCNEELNWRGNI